jgi:hypothetical protein
MEQYQPLFITVERVRRTGIEARGGITVAALDRKPLFIPGKFHPDTGHRSNLFVDRLGKPL